MSDKAFKETAVNPALPSLHGGTFFRDVPLTTLISHLIQDLFFQADNLIHPWDYYVYDLKVVFGVTSFVGNPAGRDGHCFSEQTKFFVSDGVVQKTTNN